MRTNEKVFYNNYTVRDRAVKTVSGTSTLSVSGMKEGAPASLVLYGDLRQDGIPEEYEELDYLEKAAEDCYINTRLQNTVDIGFRIETAASDVTTARAMGGVSNSSSATARSWCAYGLDNGSWTASWGLERYSYQGAVADVFSTVEVNFLNSGKFYVDSVLVQDDIGYLSQTAVSDVAIFGIRTGSTLHADTTRYAKIRRATFSYGTTLAADLFPCRRIADGELGMYDRVRKLFLTNAGASGTFTAGPVKVPSPGRPVDLVCNNGVLKAGTGGAVTAEGTIETVTAQGNGSSASAEMLMKFDGYADTQDVLTGEVVRKTMVRAFNGTENWQQSSSWEQPGTYVFYLTDVEVYHTSSDYNRTMILCTHFPAYSRTSLYASDIQGCCLSGADNTAAYTFRCSKTDITGLDAWKTWLTGQYNAGTPVIAVARRRYTSKSSVQKQAVTLLEGADTLTVSGYLKDLALSAEVYPQDTNIYKISGTAPLALPALPGSGFRTVTAYGGLEQRQQLPVLPSGYTRLGYIESGDVNCLIDTGISGVCEVILDVQGRNQTVNAFQYVISCSSSGSYNNFPNWFGRPSDTSSMMRFYGMYPGSLRCAIHYEQRAQFRVYFGDGDAPGFKQGAYLTEGDPGKVTYMYKDSEFLAPYVPVLEKNTNFHLFGAPDGTKGATCRIFWCQMFQNDTMVRYFIPVRQDSDGTLGFYDTVGQQFYANIGSGNLVSGEYEPHPVPYQPAKLVCNNGELKVGQSGSIYADGQVETLGLNGSSAALEMLLGVSGFADTQDIARGIVERRLGIKVFDGTENWEKHRPDSRTMPNVYKLDGYFSDLAQGVDIMHSGACSHFTLSNGYNLYLYTEGYYRWSAKAVDTMRDEVGLVSDTEGTTLYMCFGADSVTDVKQYLADQYESGTPVIIVYPRSEAAIETVAPAALAPGGNGGLLEITQSSLDGLQVSAEYDKPLTELKSASGISSVTLPGVPVDGLRTVTAHGGLEMVQEWPEIPAGYTRVSYIESEDVNCLIDTGVSGVCKVTIEVEGIHQDTNAYQYVIACSDTGNGHYNFPNWFGRSTDTDIVQRFYGMYNGSLRCAVFYSIRSQFTIYFDNGRNAGFFVGAMLSHTTGGPGIKDADLSYFWDGSFGGYSGGAEPVLDTSSTFHLFGSPTGQRGATCRIFWCQMFQNDVMVRYFIPVVRDSDGAAGLYDAVGQQFYGNIGTGSLIAGDRVPMPTPYRPAKLMCNGGELKVDRTTGEVYVDGAPETVGVTGTGSSAAVAPLLKVYGYEDTQDIENGVIYRNVAVKVLDGTEDWVQHTTSGNVWKLEHFCDDIAPGVPPLEFGISSHFSPSKYYSHSAVPEGYFSISTIFSGALDAEGTPVSDATADGGGVLRVVFGLENEEEVRQYLADQYAAGTPVIFAYPRVETVIEHVAPQKLLTAPGTNTLEVTESSVSGLEISADWLAVSEELTSADGTLPVPLPGFTGSGLKGVTTYGELRYSDTLSNYVRLEYLESTGTQYIDTGITTQDGIGFDAVFLTNSPLASAGDYGCIIGGRVASMDNDVQITTFSGSGFYGSIRYGSMTYNAGISLNKKLHISLVNRTLTLNDGTAVTLQSYTFTSSRNIYLFGLNSGGSFTQSGLGCRIYNVKLYVNYTTVGCFIPVRRRSDNELGMYDTVSGTFFTNAGTGSFTAGPETSDPSPELPVQLVCNNGPVLNVLPQGYVLLDYIEADNGQYITTNVSGPARWAGEAECTAEQSKSQCILSAECAGGALVYLASQVGTNSMVWSIGTSASSKTSLTTKSRTFYDLDYASAAFSGTIGSGTVTAGNSQTFTTWYIGTAFGLNSTTYPFTGKIYTQKAYQNGSLVFHGVPAKKISDGETGLFDLVTRTFFGNTSSGYFGAGPEHGSVVTGGPDEELGIGVRNMFDADELLGHRDRYEKQADGSWSIVAADGQAWSVIYQDYVVLQPGTYTLSSTVSAATFQYNGRDGTSHISGIGGSAWFSMPCTFTVTEPTEFNAKFQSSTTYPNSIGKIQLERSSSATVYADYNGSTAAAEALFRLGNYADSQELISGIVSRQLGVKVFDGTETFTVSPNYRKTDACDGYCDISGYSDFPLPSSRVSAACSHFPFQSEGFIWLSTGYANEFATNHPSGSSRLQVHFNIANDILANYGYIYGDPDYGTTTAGAAAVKAWMAAQYAAGTPVIVVYPLPKVTYSRVVPQPLADTPAGQPLDTRQAALSGLGAKASYMKERERVLSTASGTLPLALPGTDRDGIVSVTAKGSLSQGTLPQGYISLKYTGRYNNDGYPYIDTQWKPDLSKDVTITGKAVYEGGTNYRAVIIGNYSPTAAAVLNLEFYNVNSRSTFRVYRSGSDAVYCGAFAAGSEVEFSVVYTTSTGVASVTTVSDGVTATASGQLYHHGLQSDTSMRVFYDARSDRDSALKKTLKVGTLTAVEDGVTVFDYAPAVCLENGRTGFFDRVTRQFLGRADGTDGGSLHPTGGPSPDRQVAPVCNNGALVYDSVSGQVVVEGSPEALTVPGTGVSAIPETLLSLGGMTDTQDLLTGLVTRKLGIKVLTGTESWGLAYTFYIKSDATNMYITVSGYTESQTGKHPIILCNGLTPTSSAIWSSEGYPDMICSNGSGYSLQIHVNISNSLTGVDPSTDTTATAKDKLTAYLAAKYSSGNPLFIIYPLPDTATETVPSQKPVSLRGDSVLENEGEVEGLAADVTYNPPDC